MFNRQPLRRRIGDWTAKAVGWTDPVAEANEVLAKQPESIKGVRMRVLNGSRLAMGPNQPTMVFNPQWYWGREKGGSFLEVVRVEGSRLYVRDPSPAPSPPMCVTTCWLAATWPLLPLPALPPGVAIDVQTKELEGWIDVSTGEVDFSFVSVFATRLLGWATQPLAVRARMGTGEQQGSVFHAVGERLAGAHATLVALSQVPKTPDPYQNALLMLPTDALSVLKVRMEFVPRDAAPLPAASKTAAVS